MSEGGSFCLTMYKLQYNFATLSGYIFVRIKKSILNLAILLFFRLFSAMSMVFSKHSLSKVEKTAEGFTVNSLYSRHRGDLELLSSLARVCNSGSLP